MPTASSELTERLRGAEGRGRALVTSFNSDNNAGSQQLLGLFHAAACRARRFILTISFGSSISPRRWVLLSSFYT